MIVLFAPFVSEFHNLVTNTNVVVVYMLDYVCFTEQNHFSCYISTSGFRDKLLKMSVTLHTTHGDLKMELFVSQTPKTCENFLALCGTDYYNNCVFVRNIKSFMLQTGDPTNTGKGGECIWGGKFSDEIREDLKHKARGVVSMANSGPNTNGSQFFITYGAQPTLDLKYTVFGKVIDGWDTLDEIERLQVNPKNYKPLPGHEAKITNVTIHANPLAA